MCLANFANIDHKLQTEGDFLFKCNLLNNFLFVDIYKIIWFNHTFYTTLLALCQPLQAFKISSKVLGLKSGSLALSLKQTKAKNISKKLHLHLHLYQALITMHNT